MRSTESRHLLTVAFTHFSNPMLTTDESAEGLLEGYGSKLTITHEECLRLCVQVGKTVVPAVGGGLPVVQNAAKLLQDTIRYIDKALKEDGQFTDRLLDYKGHFNGVRSAIIAGEPRQLHSDQSISSPNPPWADSFDGMTAAEQELCVQEQTEAMEAWKKQINSLASSAIKAQNVGELDTILDHSGTLTPRFTIWNDNRWKCYLSIPMLRVRASSPILSKRTRGSMRSATR